MTTPSLVSVVDDDESVRESLPDMLRQFGFAAAAFSRALRTRCLPFEVRKRAIRCATSCTRMLSLDASRLQGHRTAQVIQSGYARGRVAVIPERYSRHQYGSANQCFHTLHLALHFNQHPMTQGDAGWFINNR